MGVSMGMMSLLVATAGKVWKWRIRQGEVVLFGGLIDGTSQPAAAGDYSDEAQGEAPGETSASARQASNDAVQSAAEERES